MARGIGRTATDRVSSGVGCIPNRPATHDRPVSQRLLFSLDRCRFACRPKLPRCRNTNGSPRAPGLGFRSCSRKMGFPKFIHKFCPQFSPTFFQGPSPAVQRSGGQILVSPGSHFQQEGNQCDAFLGKAVNRFLLMRRVVRLGNDPLLDQPAQPVGQDIRRDAFHRLGEEFAEMPPIHENDVADDEQSPLIAEHFHCLVDDAFRPVIRAHAAPDSNGHVPLHSTITYNQLQNTTGCVIQPSRSAFPAREHSRQTDSGPCRKCFAESAARNPAAASSCRQ